MTTMTIHADDNFAEAVRRYAERLGKSVNQAIKEAIAPIIGFSQNGNAVQRPNPWRDLYGCVPKEETEMIREAIAAQHTIDEEMWK